MIGYETGQWYVHDGEKWLLAEPQPTSEAPPQAKPEPERPTAQPAPPERPVITETKRAERATSPQPPATRSRLPVVAGIIAAAVVIAAIAQLAGQCQSPTPAPTAQPAPAATAVPTKLREPMPTTPLQNSIRIRSILPAPGTSLKTGQVTEFEVSLGYTLGSADKAVLALYVEEYPESAKGCTGSSHQTNGATTVPVSRGEGDLVIRVTWHRDPSGFGAKDIITSGTGFLSPGASLWTDKDESADKLIQQFGEFADYCYGFK